MADFQLEKEGVFVPTRHIGKDYLSTRQMYCHAARGEKIVFSGHLGFFTYVPERTCKRTLVTYQTSFYDEFAEEFEAMGCSCCEEPLSDNWSYCPSCGAKVI